MLVGRAGRRHQLENRHELRCSDAYLLLALAPCSVQHVLAALDPARRDFDQVALAQRQMRAEPELADQNDLVARKVDRKQYYHTADAKNVAFEHRAVQRDTIAVITIETAAAMLRSRQHGIS